MTERNEIKNYFESLYAKYNTKEFIITDPVVFPHTCGGNTEYTAFTSSLFAYGNVKAMQSFLTRLFESTGTDPFNLKPNLKSLKYRFQNEHDVDSYLEVMKKIYGSYGSLEKYFMSFSSKPLQAAGEVMKDIHARFISEKTHGLGFLFTIPGKSASKRLYMFLRWMIRKDDVDFGLWQDYSPSLLSMPLDTHIKNMSVKLGLIKENESDKKALDIVNAFFKSLNPEDPVKYDFSLTRLGIVHKCDYKFSDICVSCDSADRCIFKEI